MQKWGFVGVLILLVLVGVAFAEENDTNTTDNNSTATNVTTTCFDSDGGKDYEEKGKTWVGTNCTGESCTNITFPEVFDSCLDNVTLSEGFCENETRMFVNFTCSGSCTEGKCVALNTTVTCDEDSDCASGKECEDNICVLDDEDDDNETDDEVKVCCMMFNANKNETKYNRVEENDCVSGNNSQITKTIVADSFCKNQSGKEASRERQRIKFEERTGVECPEGCRCQGVVMKCSLEGGVREMTIFAGNSGNIIIQVKGVNATTNVTLYKDDNGTVYGVFRGRGEVKIKVMPDEIKIKIKERSQAKFEQEEIELNEDGAYEFHAKKKARLFWLVPVNEKFRADVDSESGFVVVRKGGSWWGFLANDVEEE